MINRVLNKVRFLLLKRSIASFEQLKKIQTLINFNEHIIVQKEILKPFYKQYISEISRADMAASLELAAFMYTICKLKGYSRLLDMGSGLSSFIFRLYAKETQGVKVYSVDDDVAWLDKTRNYLSDSKVNTENLLTLDNFILSGEKDFDFILLDLNYVEVRKNYIKLMVERCAIGGIIVFDDVHKRAFMTEVLRQTKNESIRLYDLSELTKDEFERFSIVGIKN